MRRPAERNYQQERARRSGRINPDPEWKCMECSKGGPIARHNLRCVACSQRAWRRGHGVGRNGNLDRVFWTRTMVPDGPNPCALWTGARSASHYGLITRNNKAVLAHRHAWTLAYGPIPDGLFVCHHCDTPLCVQPAHLFLGTIADNNRDAGAKGRTSAQTMPEVLRAGLLRWIAAHPEQGPLRATRMREAKRGDSQVALN